MIDGFPLTIILFEWYYLILGGTNNVLRFSVTKMFVHSVETGTSEKVLQ